MVRRNSVLSRLVDTRRRGIHRVAEIITIAISVIGIFVPILWSRFNTKRDMEVQVLSSVTMFENAQDGPSLGLSFHGKEIPNLTKSEIAIVNTGRAEITKDDIMTPMSIVFPGGAELLFVSVTGGSTEGRQAKAEIGKPGEAVITFPLLNPGGTVRISAYLTGNVAAPKEVRAAIKGVSRLRIIDKTRQPIVRTVTIGWTTIPVAVFTLLLLAVVPEMVRQVGLQLEARSHLEENQEFLDEMSLEELMNYSERQMTFTAEGEQAQLKERLGSALTREEKEDAYRDWIRFYIKDVGAATAALVVSLIGASIGAIYVGVRVRKFLKWRRAQIR